MARPEDLQRADDSFHTYALQPYRPPTSPEGKLRAANLLLRSFDALDIGPTADALCAASVAEVGRGGTAWGIKQQGDAISWELYYYYHWDRQPLTYARLARILDPAPVARAPLPPSARSWYSLSFDVSADVLRGEAPIDGYHVYATLHPAEPRTCLSYAVSSTEGLRLENVYHLFDPATDGARLETYLASSAFAPERSGPPAQLLWPELCHGDHVALAHKPTCEGIYFGGVDVDALLAFLHRTSFAPWLTEHVTAERDRYDHLLFDVGFDYVWRAGRPEVIKAGLYGQL